MGIFDRIAGRAGPPRGDAPRDVIDASGSGRVPIVGESHYQTALAAAAGPKRRGGVNVSVTAALIREPDNPYDSRAVAVRLVDGGEKVGYLSREHAVEYGGLVEACAARGAVTVCEAVILGGDSDRGTIYCVWLHVQPAGWRP